MTHLKHDLIFSYFPLTFLPQSYCLQYYFQRPQIEALCAYRDVSGIFTTHLPADVDEHSNDKESIFEEPTTVENIDNEDELLYGDVPAFQMPSIPQTKPSDLSSKKSPW